VQFHCGVKAGRFVQGWSVSEAGARLPEQLYSRPCKRSLSTTRGDVTRRKPLLSRRLAGRYHVPIVITLSANASVLKEITSGAKYHSDGNSIVKFYLQTIDKLNFDLQMLAFYSCKFLLSIKVFSQL